MKNQNLQTLIVIFVLFLGISSSHTLKAQSEFGIKGGALYSGFKPTHYFNSLNFDTHSGFELGLFYRMPKILGPIGFQTEFLYQLKGAHVNVFTSDYGYGSPYANGGNVSNTGGYGYYGDNSSWVMDKQKYHYFTIPVLLTVSPLKFFDIYGGVEFGYMFAESKDRLRYIENNKFSTGLALGAALKLGDNTKLDFRYSSDLTPFFEVGDAKLKSRSFSVSVQQTLFRKQK